MLRARSSRSARAVLAAHCLSTSLLKMDVTIMKQVGGWLNAINPQRTRRRWERVGTGCARDGQIKWSQVTASSVAAVTEARETRPTHPPVEPYKNRKVFCCAPALRKTREHSILIRSGMLESRCARRVGTQLIYAADGHQSLG